MTSKNPSKQAENCPAPLSDQQLRRWAKLIADGEDEFPEELDEHERQRLAFHVRSQLRERMLDLIAQAIAVDIHRRTLSDKEVRP